MYNIDESGNIWIIKSEDKFHHNSLLPKTAPSKGAGMIEIEQNKVISVDAASGHYMMDDPFLSKEKTLWELNMKAHLKKLGFKIMKVSGDIY